MNIMRMQTLTIALLLTIGMSAGAETNIVGTVDGSFETDLSGASTDGSVSQVANVGILNPTEGIRALLMTTEPDAGSAPGDADVSTLLIENFTIDAAYSSIRLDYNFLTNEPDPSFANDSFEVTLLLVTAGGQEIILSSDTFDTFNTAPWTGYELQTGFRSMIADVSSVAGSGDLVSLELRIADLGDGRRDSAVIVDDLRLVEPGVPSALVADSYVAIDPGASFIFDGSGSSDDVGIVAYDWDFANGFTGSGSLINMDQYTDPGFYQGTLTVTDGDGFTDTASFTVAVGDPNSAPSIVSSPSPYAAELVPYSYQIVAEDAEIVFGDSVSYALVSGPAGMSVAADTGLLSWLPPSGLSASTPVTVAVTDTFGASDSQSFTIIPGPEVYVATMSDDSRLYTARSNGDGTFSDFRFDMDVGPANPTSRGVVIADFTGDDNFDLITGYPESSRLQLFLFERVAGVLGTPTYLGEFDTANPSYLMDMAAEDFDNDADIDFVLNTNTARTWYFENTGPLVTAPENFFASDFETGNEGWAGQQTRTTLARDDTTSNSGDWSMRVSASGTPTTLSIDINPSNWYMVRGSTVRFDYRIPPGVPAGLLFQVAGRDWIWLGGAPASDPGTFTVAPGAVTLIDDDTWRSVEINVYDVIREVWPEAYQLSEFQFWTNNNAAAGDQFWFDDFRITRPRMVSGFSPVLLPDTGSAGRGMDAGDANNDGNMDFVRARSGGQLFLYTGDGAGNFSTSQFGTTSNPYGLVLADFDNDGNADAIAINNGSGDPYFYAGNGDGTFQAGVLVPSMDVNNYASYGVFDFDNDGNMDVVVSTHSSRQLWYYPGNGDATFGTRTLIGSTTTPAANILAVAAPAGRSFGQPFASATQDATVIDENGTVNFDASASYDDGNIVSYEWDFGDGNMASGITAANTYISEGSYTVLLTLTDDDGLQDRFSLKVTVNGDLPVANPAGPYALGEAQALLGIWHGTLDGTASSDADTSIARYEWDFDASDGLGVDSTQPYPRPAYVATGVYTVTLTVYDEVGQSATTTTTVTVSAGAAPVPGLAGPAALDERNASLAKWTGWFDTSSTTDDFGAANYSIDWGDTSSDTLSPLADDFSDGNYTVNPVWNVNGGTWSVSDGVLQQTGLGVAWRWLQDRNRVYRDFQLEVDFQAVAGATDGYIGIVFHNANTAGSTNSFLMYSRNSWDAWRFYDWQTATVLVEGGTGWDPGVWYHLRLVMIGDTMQLFVTPQGGVESLQIEAASPAHPSGGIGLLANDQYLRYDNVKVTPLDNEWTANGAGPADFAKTYDSAGTYPITLNVTDHAAQSVNAVQSTDVGAGTPPEADAGGPYVLDETDAYGAKWNLIVDASDSIDDTNVERYTVDFGDGTSYTTGFADGVRGSYFATGTDLYGFDTAGADLRRVIATEDATQIEIIDLATNTVIDSITRNRLQAWDPTGSPPGDGIAYKVKATKPVVAYFTNFGHHNAFVPSMDGDPVGKEFIFYLDINGGFYVYAHEDAVVQFFNSAGTLVTQRNLRAGSYWTASATASANDYRVVSSGRISMQTTGNNGFTTVPSDNGDGAGRLFYFATRIGTTESIAAFAYEAADIEVFDLDSGESLYTASILAGDVWYQSEIGTRRMRLESTADVEVWAGDTQGSPAITSLGDDISFAGGRGGTEFVLHTLNDGVVIFAPNDNTTVDIDSGGLTATLQRDEFLRLSPADFPGGSGVHRIVTSEPVVIQTMGQANTYNDLGSYLGGVSMRHQYAATGTYTLTLTTTDNAGQTDTTTTTVEVLASDPPVPVIDAPAVADENFAEGGLWTVEFDASGSSDDVGIFSYEWDFGDGAAASGVQVSHVYGATGDYTVTLTVTDHGGQSVSTTQLVQVTLGAAPVADAGGPYIFGEEAASLGVWTATLDGTGSTDDSAIFDYTWLFGNYIGDDFEDGLIDPTWFTSSSAVEAAGRLTITGQSGWNSQGFYSTGTAVERIANREFRAQVLTPASGSSLMMWGVHNATSNRLYYLDLHHAIYFNNGNLLIYEDGSNRGTVGSYAADTLYDLRIVVKSAGADYFIREAGTAGWTQLTSFSPLNRSTSPLQIGADVHSGAWAFDNITVPDEESGAIVQRQFTEPGIHSVTLTVRDNALQSDSDTTTFEIADGDDPVADAAGPYTVEVGSLLNFNGTNSTDDNGIERYVWDFGDTTGGPVAPGSQTADLPFTANGPTPRHFYHETGVYTATLQVFDNTNKSSSDSATVNVVVGDSPVANAQVVQSGGANGPPVYFDAGASSDDYGIVQYRWDFDIAVDSDGDGDPANDLDGTGRTPFHTYGSATAGPVAALLFTETFSTPLNSGIWTTAGGTVGDGVLSITGAGGWASRYIKSVNTFGRGGTSLTGQVRQAPGVSRAMWGVKSTSTSNSYIVMPHAIYFNNGTLNIYENNSPRGTVNNFSYERDVFYDVRIDPLATGAEYYMRRSGVGDPWTLLTGFTTTATATTPLVIHATVLDGSLDFDNFAVEVPADRQVRLTVVDGAGQTSTSQVSVPVSINEPPHVITVPWVAFDPLVAHETYNGKAIRLKAIVRDADAATFQWDFGDGTQSTITAVTDNYDLSVTHTYPDAPDGTPFVATVSVTDAAGNVGSATYPIIVKPLNLTTEINVAIDEGLWYLHQTQTRSSAEGFDTGYWTSNARASATASAIQAFEVNGHLETIDHRTDPYAENVMRGLRQLFRDLGTLAIATQTYGEPDTNGNGIGIQTGVNGSGGQPIYQGGQVMDAIASSGSPLRIAVTGADGIKGRRYFDILTDMTDAFAWGQTEQGSGGAWRYNWNNSIDNSAAQWGAIGPLAAQDIFGIPIPDWVKERNLVWLNNSYSGVGWGYGASGTSSAGTPSGMVQMVLDEQTTDDPRWITAEKWMADNWSSQYIITPGNRPYYQYYALTKAMRLGLPNAVETFASNGFDWFRDPVLGLARTLVDDQMANGRFPGSQWITAQLRSAWGVIILSRTLFVQPPVADAGRDRVWGVDLPLQFDGSNSFHLDPFRSIIKYEWDFDGDGTFDFESDQPLATYTYTLADYPEADLPVTINARLRVTDNNIPALTDNDTVEIIVAIPPHPPIAEAGGPYTCTAGLPCRLDGSASFDIDPTDFIARYEWDLDGFPFEYTGASGVNPEPAFAEGVFNIGLQVFDNGVLNDLDGDGELDENERLSDVDFAIVTALENLPPVADANGPYTVDEGGVATLDGTGSSDPNGDPLTFLWDLDNDGDYDDAAGPNPNFLGVDDGAYTVGLRVTDGLLDDTTTATVIVNNLAPTVDAGPDVTIDEGATVDFAGNFSDPGVLDTHTIEWDFGDGNTASGSLTPDHVYPDDGIYTVTLTVTDDDGGVGSDTLTVTVGDLAPAAAVTGDTTLVEGDTGSFDASASTSAPDAIVGYEWDFDYDGTFDPSAETGVTATSLFPEDGSFTVALRVTDDDFSTSIATIAVTVANAPPVVEAGADQTGVLVGSAIALDPATYSDLGVLDTHSAIIDWGDGTDESGVVTQGAGSGSVDGSHVYATADTFTVTVTVTDDDGGVGTDTFTVSVITTPNTPPVVDAGPDTGLIEGDTFSSAGSFVDPDVDTWTATVDYGEGAGPQPLALNPDGSFALSNVYEDDGVYTVTVTVNDDAGGVGSDSAQVTVDNAPPLVDAGADQAGVLVGSAIALDPATFTDLGVLDTHTATIDWGDGTDESGVVTQGAGSGSVAGSHVYTTVDTFTVTVTVTDDDGGVGSDTLTVEVLPIPNTSPAVDAGPDTGLIEGDTFSSAGSFVDPDVDTWTATVDYGEGAGPQPLALNPDGSFALSNVYEDDGVYTVTVTVNDDAGGVGSDSAQVTVDNAPPLVDAGADQAGVLVGSAIALDPATFTDLGVLDTHTATIDWGDGTDESGVVTQGAGSGSVAGSHVYTTVDTFTVTVTVTDDDGGVGSDTLTVEVLPIPNTSPAVDAGPDTGLIEGDTFSSAGSFVDPDVDTWTATVDYGEGAGPQPLALNPDGSFALSNVYEDDGVYTVTVTVNDDAGGVGSDSAQVTVDNAPPLVDAGADQAGVLVGSAIALDPATFTDPGVLDTHTATIDWGDGTVEPGVVTQGAGSGSVAGSHVYTTVATFTVTVTVTDDDGGVGADTLSVTVDPAVQPDAPADLDARPKRNKIQLTWTHNGADSYNVYRSLTSGSGFTLLANTTSTYSTYLDQGLTTGTTYYYYVTSLVAGSESVPSVEVNATLSARSR